VGGIDRTGPLFAVGAGIRFKIDHGFPPSLLGVFCPLQFFAMSPCFGKRKEAKDEISLASGCPVSRPSFWGQSSYSDFSSLTCGDGAFVFFTYQFNSLLLQKQVIVNGYFYRQN
jgi:hypothetical protein